MCYGGQINPQWLPAVLLGESLQGLRLLELAAGGPFWEFYLKCTAKEEKTTTSLLKPSALWDLLLENTLPVSQVSILPWSCSTVRVAGTLGCPLLLSAAGLLPGRFSPLTPVPGNSSLTPCLCVTPIALPLAKFLQSQRIAQLPAHVFVFAAHQQTFKKTASSLGNILSFSTLDVVCTVKPLWDTDSGSSTF